MLRRSILRGLCRKKNKTNKATGNPLTIDDGGDYDDVPFGVPTKAKGGKKKHSVEGNSPRKKKKKKKKNGTFIDLTIQSSSDLESVKEAEDPLKALKKKRKRGLSRERRNGPEIPSQGQTTECLDANFLLGKKRKMSVPETCGDNNGYSTRRKKKKHKLARSLTPSHPKDDSPPKDLPPAMKIIAHETMLPDRKPALIQDAVSKEKSKCICCLTSTDSRETSNGVLEKGPVDPTRELQGENNCKRDHVSKKKRQVTEQGGKKKRKKKKKKKKLKEEEVDLLLTLAGDQENHPDASPETLWKTQPEEETKKTHLIQNSKEDSKGRKKEKIHARVANSYSDLLEYNKDASEGQGVAIKRAKKKAKKSKERDPAGNSGKPRAAPKRKAKGREGSEVPDKEPSSKKARLKKEGKEREDEIQVVAIKKGNCDEVTIDKLRRQALQEEIDRESGKMKATKEEDNSDHHFGQWSTATFDNPERKAKFLRLLGGFKRGPALIQESPAKTTRHSMALARHGEETLRQTLQAEFEKAMDWKKRPHAGLGSQPAPRKQVYIDKYASSSVKFED